MKGKGRIIKSIIFLCVVLACALLIWAIMPVVESKGKLSEIFLAQPVFAQQATAFPANEAGISAYVNVGQSIDLSKAKNAMRGIQAEGSNYVIGIMELSGLPEEEFPHMYISSDGWILAYYSKFAPASRIMHWGKYSGGMISTTTLKDAISKICPAIGSNFSQVEENLGYYDFKYPEAAKMVIAVDIVDDVTNTRDTDTMNFSIPNDVTLYEASFSHRSIGGSSFLKVDGDSISSTSKDASYLDCDYLEDLYLVPGKVHIVLIDEGSWGDDWLGVAVVFIYR